MKSGAGILFSLCLGAALLAVTMSKGLTPDPLTIGHGMTLTVALAVMVVYCLDTSGVGTPTHTVGPTEGSWSQSP